MLRIRRIYDKPMPVNKNILNHILVGSSLRLGSSLLVGSSLFVGSSLRLEPTKQSGDVNPESVKKNIKERSGEQIALVVNERHIIHHIHERGYVESPARIGSILNELEKTGLFSQIKPRNFPDKHIQEVHDADFISYIRKACAETPDGKSLYPYVFPIRNKTRLPEEPSVLAGYYCIDTFTPINKNAYIAARRGADCALTVAQEILEGRRIAYALIRPPGHHAERRSFGGFCYFNNNAITAHYLSSYGRVAILDIDYHHGNGQQNIFYRRSDVLTVSIHGHPKFAYPYFTGFEDEHGEGEGEGFNLNLPLSESIDGKEYRKALDKALQRIEEFKPDFLVVAFGLDTAKGDPAGTWSLVSKDFEANGSMIGELNLPIVVIQEGGYRTRTLGINARNFFNGLAKSSFHLTDKKNERKERLESIIFRYDIQEADIESIRKLVEVTGFFNPAEILIAAELVQERLVKGEESGYYFIFAEQNGRLIGYSCYGPIPGTASGFDLYWIAVHPDFQGKGLGKVILKESEKMIHQSGGTRIYIETSQRIQYANTRAFYEHCGYTLVSLLDDFYAPGDAKATYCKSL